MTGLQRDVTSRQPAVESHFGGRILKGAELSCLPPEGSTVLKSQLTSDFALLRWAIEGT